MSGSSNQATAGVTTEKSPEQAAAELLAQMDEFDKTIEVETKQPVTIGPTAAEVRATEIPASTGADIPLTSSEARALIEKLAAAEARAQQLEIEKQELQEQAAAQLSNRRLRAEAAPFAPPGGSYRFRCGPAAPEKYPHLKIWEGMACDESEVKRWYAANFEEVPGSGKQIDPMSVKLAVECVDPKRAQVLVLQKRLAALRQKVNMGSALSRSDQELLERFEADVFQYSTGAT